MTTIRIGAAIVAGSVLAVLGCGGKSTARAVTGADAAGADAARADAGTVVIPPACAVEGATELLGSVRFQCTNGTWTPVTPCMMGGDVDACGFAWVAMSSESIATDPCLVPSPPVTPDGSEACVPTTDSTGCGPIGPSAPFPTRIAELAPDGSCVAVSECQHSTDCVVAINHLACCACPEAFPQSLLAREPCITTVDASPAAACIDEVRCAGADCASCEPGASGYPPPRPDLTARCIPNGSGLRVCAFAPDWVDCTAQDATGVIPSPPPGDGCAPPPSWVWNGMACVEFEGCQCSGTDCAALFTSPEACLDRYRACGAVCVPGTWDCNDDLAMSSIAGHCGDDGTCICDPGRTFVDASGRCR